MAACTSSENLRQTNRGRIKEGLESAGLRNSIGLDLLQYHLEAVEIFFLNFKRSHTLFPRIILESCS